MSIDVLIVIIFLIINLVVGLYYGRKVKTVKEYALGGRNFNTATIAATIVATWIGGSSFGINLYGTYSQGLYFILPGLADAISFLIIGYFIAPYLGPFLGKLSIAEVMGDIYDDKVKAISAISSIIPAIGNIAIQFSVLSFLLKYLLGDISFYIIAFSCCIVILYSVLGGIRAVTFTDILQFATFGIFIPILALIIWKSLDNTNSFVDLLNTNQLFNYRELSNINNPKVLDAFLVFLFFLIPGFDPALFQRISMAKNISQVTKACIITAGVTCLVYLCLDFIGVLVLSEDLILASEDVLQEISDNYLGSGFKGIFFIGIMAMAMSTADSYINSSAILFTHDFLKSVGIKFSDKQELLTLRISSIIIGVSALFLSMYSTSLLNLILATYSFFMPIVSVPLLLAIFGFRSSSRTILIGMLAGFLTVISIKLFFEMDSLVPGMLSNLMVLLLFHYLMNEPGGWIGNKNNPELSKIIEFRKKRKKAIFYFFTHLLSNLRQVDIIKYCNSKLPNNNSTYLYFSFIVFLTLLTSISIKNELYHNHTYFINTLQTLILSIAISFLCYDLWSKTFKEKYLGIVWCLSIFISLTFISSFLVLMSEFSHISLIILTIHLIIVPLLVGWRIALIMIITGLWLSFSLYENYISEMAAGAVYNLKLKLLYLLFIVSGFSITLLKSKEKEHKSIQIHNKNLEKEVDYTQRELDNIKQGIDFLDKQLKQKEDSLKKKELYLKDQLKIRNTEISKLADVKNEFLRNINHESNTPLIGIISMCDVLYSCYDQLDNNQIKQTIKNIVNSGDRLKSYVNSIVDLSKLTSNRYKLTKEDVSLGELAKERTILYKKIFSDETKKQKFIFSIENDSIAKCDRYYITQTIDNLISNAVNYGKGKPITISIKKEEDKTISFSIKDQGIGIPKLELLSIFDKFSVGSKTRTLAGGRGVGLALCKSVIEAHNGTIIATSDVNGSTFTFIVPK